MYGEEILNVTYKHMNKCKTSSNIRKIFRVNEGEKQMSCEDIASLCLIRKYFILQKSKSLKRATTTKKTVAFVYNVYTKNLSAFIQLIEMYKM